jgi:transposase
MYNRLERDMVQKLKKQGIKNAEISQMTGIGARTVQRIDQEPEMVESSEAEFRQSHPVGRPSSVKEYESLIQSWLLAARNPEDGPLKSAEIYSRLKKMGYEGGKTAVYELVRKIRPPEAKVPVVRFEGLPGEFSQHDFGQRRVNFTSGETQVVRCFASRLKYSRFMDVQMVENEQSETVIRCLLRAFERFGGMPLQCVFDNLKADFHQPGGLRATVGGVARPGQRETSLSSHWRNSGAAAVAGIP